MRLGKVLVSAIGGALLAPGALAGATEEPPATMEAPPTAALVVTPDQPRAGDWVRLDASASRGEIVSYRWDLDGDGSFETAGDTDATTRTKLDAGSHVLAVQVANPRGETGEATERIEVASATPVADPEPKQTREPKPKPKSHRTRSKVVRAAASSSVAIKNFAFMPRTIDVSVGDTVTWTNHDDAPHTATGNGGSFNTGTLKRGQSGSHTFTRAGTFAYICAIHPNMHGTVVVAAAGGSSSGSSNGSGGGSSGSTASGPSSGSAAPADTGGGTLPRTGIQLIAVLLMGFAMTAGGAAMRWILART